MRVRLDISGLANGDSFPFPLTQEQLGWCLGLTAVHVNRTLQELRRRGLVEVERGSATIVKRAELEAVAEFDPAYLYLERKAR